MIINMKKEYEVQECGLPDPDHFYIFSLEGEFSLHVYDCKNQCFVEAYTMVSQVNVNHRPELEIVHHVVAH